MEWNTAFSWSSAAFLCIFAACKHDPTRQRLAEIFALPTPLEKYHRLLDGLVAFIERVYGPAGSRKSFLTCLAIALLYPAISFIWGYAWDHSLKVQRFIMRPRDVIAYRWFWPIWFTVCAIAGARLVRWSRRNCVTLWLSYAGRFRYPKMWNALLATIAGILVCLPGAIPGSYPWQWNATVALVVAMSFALGTSIGLATFAMFWIAYASFFPFGTSVTIGYGASPWELVYASGWSYLIAFGAACAYLFLSAVARTRTIGVAIALAIAAAVFVPVWVGGFPFRQPEAFGSAGYTFALLVFVLPVVNGIFDWCSWYAARYFIGRAQDTQSTVTIVRDLALSLLIALFLLTGLALALPGAFVFVNWTFRAGPELDWSVLARLTREAPWREGGIGTLMLLVTLVPTALHLLVGTLAAVIHCMRNVTFVAFLEDPFRGTKNKGNYVDAFRAAAWLSCNLSLSLGVIAAACYLLIGAPQMRIGEWLFVLVRVWTSHGAVGLGSRNTVVDVGDVHTGEYGPEGVESVTGVDGAQVQSAA